MKQLTLCFCVNESITTSLIDKRGECINDTFELEPGSYELVSITKCSPNGDYDLCIMINGKIHRLEFWIDPDEPIDNVWEIKADIIDYSTN